MLSHSLEDPISISEILLADVCAATVKQSYARGTSKVASGVEI